jgi:hypothetical protein
VASTPEARLLHHRLQFLGVRPRSGTLLGVGSRVGGAHPLVLRTLRHAGPERLLGGRWLRQTRGERSATTEAHVALHAVCIRHAGKRTGVASCTVGAGGAGGIVGIVDAAADGCPGAVAPAGVAGGESVLGPQATPTADNTIEVTTQNRWDMLPPARTTPRDRPHDYRAKRYGST